MRVLLVCYEYPRRESSAIVSGEIKHPWNLARWLVGAGHEVHVLSCSSEQSSFVDEVCGAQVTAINVHRGRGVFRHYRRAVEILRSIRRLQQGTKFDVIHTHVAYGALAARVALGHSGRLVSTAHGTNIPEISTELARGTRLRWPRWINAVGQALLDAVGWRSADTVVSVSQYQVDELARIYRIPRTRIRVVSTGVDERYSFDPSRRGQVRADLGIPADAKVVLLCGRLAKKKRFGWALRALARHDSVDARHVICVTGTDEFVTDSSDFEAALRETADRLTVTRLHAVPEGSLPGIYCAADAFVCPSSGYESLPNVVLEALRSGLKVVATDAWGHRELADAVVLFREDDSAGLQQAVARVLAEPSCERPSRAPDWVTSGHVVATLETLYGAPV